MQHRTGAELRELFIRFWQEKGSHHYPSFSLIPDDPSLLFTIAGMVPFKPYYLGIRQPEHPQAVTSQKCVRTNDIENVGRTARHHTFFEMLGNFAWGEYFKKEAIAWAWEFLTEWVGMEPDKFYATIYTDDEEARESWVREAGLPEERILRFGQDNNYWFMGETGPCGPCSELYYDRGASYGCSSPACGPGCDCDRYMEIWNLVFTQFDRQKDGSLTPLPRKNIDTGMGLERLTSIVQGVDTDYETDLFRPLIDHTCRRAGITYGSDAKTDMPVRVIADHIRSVAFMLADGVLPANDGPGYVLRRLLRRAVRYGRLLGFEGPFLCEYLPILIDIMKDPYRELCEQRLTIEQIIGVEEERFQRTLQQGTELFEAETANLARTKTAVFPGEAAFILYDTYGFPMELTLEMAAEQGLTVDQEGFRKAMEEQRERARASSKQKKSSLAGDVYTELESEQGPTRFSGYTTCTDTGQVKALLTADGPVQRVEALDGPVELEVILDVTPFYAERGGEVGDQGELHSGTDTAVMEVTNTVPHGGLIVHKVLLQKGAVSLGDRVQAIVNDGRRCAIRRNHTATHLLHEALGRVLGGHVRQAGSLVTDQFLRFDFTHHEAMTPEQLRGTERLVNQRILANQPLSIRECDREEAREMGAKALFDEKYGSTVRVVSIPDFSTELCGGLHVSATGEIGCFKILREESIGSGTRRILAVTGLNTLKLLQRSYDLMFQVAGILATDEENLPTRAQELLDELHRVKRQAQETALREFTKNVESLFTHKDVDGVTLQTGRFSGLEPDALREIGDRAKAKASPTVVVMADVTEDNCRLVVMADDAAVERGAKAGDLVRAAASLMGGKGGGRANTAQGGGGDVARLDDAIAAIETLLASQVNQG
ncbi:MAG: alanine--tRNA ligase [Fretibacterium sp.]|nr:alanine--tRNA ligase [Fretibacterium sp.]